MKKTLGDRLRELRDRSSQAEIANKIGVSGQSWGFYERNQKEPTIETIGNICRLFGVSSDWLLGLSGEVPKPLDAHKESVSDQSGKGADYWRNLAIIQQDTISKLTALLAEGRATVAGHAQTGGRGATKTA
jgi:transcriptional regulator with XRE-family HTH domain